MIAPRKIKFEATKKRNENYEFRIFLKENADDKALDEQFHRLHKELFSGYDCSRCRNCCKMYHGQIPEKDLDRDAKHLGLTKEQFIEKYLGEKDIENQYPTKNKPCDFLDKDGNCRLGDCRPEFCKDYPYTNQPDRWASLYSVLDVIEVCPVAFEIYERLKKEYGWRYGNRGMSI